MKAFNIIWKFAIVGFLLAITVSLGKIEKQFIYANEQIKVYFSFEDIPLPE